MFILFSFHHHDLHMTGYYLNYLNWVVSDQLQQDFYFFFFLLFCLLMHFVANLEEYMDFNLMLEDFQNQNLQNEL